MNGNPVRACSTTACRAQHRPDRPRAFANTAAMHEDAVAAGIWSSRSAEVRARRDRRRRSTALDHVAHCEAIIVDFDIDVIDRGNAPARPARGPAGCPSTTSSAPPAALAREPTVRLVDLTEFDPSLDVSDITALTAARWVAEILAGYALR